MTTKLLAVDDSKTMRRVLEITFGGEEFQTKICGSAAEALQAIGADRPQVALVDAALGAESGYELCRRIKADAPDVRVLILSSKHRPYDEGQGSSAGADGHFDKPFDSQKIIEKVLGLVGAPAAGPVAPRPHAPAPAVPRPALGSSAPRPAVSAAPVAAAPRPVAPSPQVSRPPLTPARPVSTPAAPRVAPVKTPAPAATAAVARATTSAQFSDKLKDLGLSAAQLEGVLALSREVVEQVVWEVVPTLAETLIKEEIARLTAE